MYDVCCMLQMLRIIRENAVVIVIGETGSGKTTQLTQVCRIYYSMPRVFHLTVRVTGATYLP